MTSAMLPVSMILPLPRWPAAFDTAGVPATRSVESDLIDRVLGGESGLFYQLVRPCERSMFFAAQSFLGNEADAEDVVQEAALKAFKALSTFRREAKFSTWLVQITINEAKSKLRKDRRQLYQSIEDGPGSDGDDYVAFDVPDGREIPSEVLLRKELRDVLKKALNSLPRLYRVIVTLRDIQGLSTEEAAQALGLTEANVKTRLSRARLQMRNELEKTLQSSRKLMCSDVRSRRTYSRLSLMRVSS